MRPNLLFPLIPVLLVIAGCALPRPTSWKPEPFIWTGAQGELAYEVKSPRGTLTGRAFFVAQPSFFYLEVPNPFGLAEAQGLVAGQEARLLVFSQRTLFRLTWEEGQDLACCWGAIVLGHLPPSWLEGALVFASHDGYLLRRDLSSLYVKAFFDKEGNLLRLTVKGEKTYFDIRYTTTHGIRLTEIKIPPLKTLLRLKFLRIRERAPTSLPALEVPPGFREKVFNLASCSARGWQAFQPSYLSRPRAFFTSSERVKECSFPGKRPLLTSSR